MTESASTLSGRRDTYLVVMREVLVAQDLCLTICDFDPAARVIIASGLEAAIAELANVPSLAVAFVEERHTPVAASDLAAAIARRGGRVVVLGEQAGAQAPARDWDILQKPFVTEQVLSLLSRRRPDRSPLRLAPVVT